MAKTLFSVGSQVVGILGNEKADAAAKFALSLPVTRMKLPATGMYPRITKLILNFDEWQEVWNCCAGNKLHAIRPTVGDYKQKTCLSRRDSVLLNRLRIGHTHLTHSFLLSGDDLPECGTCQCPLTVKHILVECVDLKDVRNKHFVASSIKDLFDSIEAHKIIDVPLRNYTLTHATYSSCPSSELAVCPASKH